MKNIIDYLKENKHLSFVEEPFNEVDGLLLSEVAYTNFDSILNENTNLDIVVVNHDFWELHTEEEIMSSISYTKMAPFLMKEMADSVRYKGMRFKNYVSNVSLKKIKQFAAITFELPDGSDFISFRGTNGTVTGWLEDFKFSYSTTDGQDDAVSYIDKFHSHNNRPLRLGGHSKGGNLAVYAAIHCKKAIQDNIEKVFSYDGPGFKTETLDSVEYERILPRIISVIPRDCMVGVMLNNRYKTIITNSDARSMFQHDAYQWHIEGNKFEELPERGELSFFFEKVLNDWMLRFDESKREKVLDVVFSLITDNSLATDDTPLDQKFFHNFLVNSKKLSHPEKSLLISSLSEIFVSTSVVTQDELKAKTAPIAVEIKEKRDTIADDVKEKYVPKIEKIKDKSIIISEEVKDKYVPIIEKLTSKAKKEETENENNN